MPSRCPGFKLAVFLLLIANTVVFVIDGTPSEGLDAAAWLTLVLLFEVETAHADWLTSRRNLFAVHAARLAAGAAVLTAAVGYIRERAWLDALNAWLWIAVVALLEWQVRFGARPERRNGGPEVFAAMLYLGLASMALAWAWRGEWFDAYDAALWVLAFATIEMNVLGRR